MAKQKPKPKPKQKTLADHILRDFEGCRGILFQGWTDEEFIGYVTCSTRLQNPSLTITLNEILIEVRRLFKNGLL